MLRFESTLSKKRLLGPYERFSAVEPPSAILPNYANSERRWSWNEVCVHVSLCER
jgi:hypothetical protein